ncbi:MAG: DUF4494 domain-containing protein [Acidobacteriota bacterium]|jgi:hypothetical protein
MNTWFEVKIKFNKTGDDGKDKTVSETYLFDAKSFTEAEARTIEELTPYVSGELKIEAIKKANIVELFPYDSGEIWFKVAAEMITLDEGAGKEKKVKLHYLILADDIQQALTRFTKNVDASVVPYIVTLITMTGIIEVYPYNESE